MSGGGTADRCLRFWNTLTGQAMQCVDTGSQVCNVAWSKHTKELVCYVVIIACILNKYASNCYCYQELLYLYCCDVELSEKMYTTNVSNTHVFHSLLYFVGVHTRLLTESHYHLEVFIV